MKFDRTRNAFRNILIGSIQKIYQILVPFFIRNVMIYYLGVEYLGLDGLFTSILSVLNLMELGIGSAMVYSMYKPVADDDIVTICSLLNLYKKLYRIIGLVILFFGTALCPFIPNLIHGNVPENLNVITLYLLNLITNVLSYWLFAYKNSLLNAYQRFDILSIIHVSVNTLKYIVQILVLIIFRNYYAYLYVLLFCQILTNIVISVIVDKRYPSLKAYGKLPLNGEKHFWSNVKDLFTARIGIVVVDSVDTIVISAFLGLKALAIYQNYFYVLTAAHVIVSTVMSSITSIIGNSIISESKEKNYRDFCTISFLIIILGTIAATCMLSIYQPFMRLWVGENFLLDYPAVICFTLYFFLKEINAVFNLYKDAAGIWHQDRWRPFITGVTNLAFNLITVKVWGIYGVILSTVFSMMFVGIPWILNNLFSNIFEKKLLKKYIMWLFKIVLFSFLLAVFLAKICVLVKLGDVETIIIDTFIIIVVSIFAFYFMYNKTDEYNYLLVRIKRIVNRK